MVDDRENLDPEDKKEDSFEFDSAGEAIDYISMAQARLLAMRTAKIGPLAEDELGVVEGLPAAEQRLLEAKGHRRAQVWELTPSEVMGRPA